MNTRCNIVIKTLATRLVLIVFHYLFLQLILTKLLYALPGFGFNEDDDNIVVENMTNTTRGY